ncbi:DUF2306 domain-containing protein [Pseudoneobacillus sp. C159]
MKKFGVGLVILMAFLLAVSALIRYLALDPVSTNKTLIEQGMDLYDFHYKPWNIVLILHIVTASLALVIGPFQFFKKLRNQRKTLHRNLGKIYVATILISGLTGIYLSFYAFGGFLSKVGFFALSIAWLVTTYLAYKYVRKKQFKLHENWMYRSYAVTFVAITFRIWSAVIGYSFDNFKLGYSMAIWVGLIGNMLVMEYWLRKSKRVKKNSSVLTA